MEDFKKTTAVSKNNTNRLFKGFDILMIIRLVEADLDILLDILV